jgi:hypothetical protein
MPYDINWEANGVHVRFQRIFNLKNNNSATIELLNDSRFEGLKYIIWDLSDISELDITETEASMLSIEDKLITSRLPKVKMALFAPDKQVCSICFQYVASSLHQEKIKWDFWVSDSMENIRAWIGC